MGKRPLIGIPCFSTERADSRRPVYASNKSYVRAIERAGGVPLLLPPMDLPESRAAALAAVDGLLLTGGGDLDPAYYGEAKLPQCDEPEVERDTLEFAFTQDALAERLPIFGVCRGMQLLNVARGGNLIQDLATQRPEVARHDHSDHPRTYRAHSIAVNPASRLSGILGVSRTMVNSFHHQAVDRPGAGVEIVAWSEDGVAEAMELADYPFALAVQYHPEELVTDDDEASERLFRAFVEACRR
jgi:putative glutamine amidotransferase